MNDKLLKKTELVANVAIIVVALLLCGVLVKRYFIGSVEEPGRGVTPPLAAGTKVSVPGVEWRGGGQTLLLVLQRGCRYCTESAPFYQRLVRETAGNEALRLIAVLPQDVGEGKAYLRELGVPLEEVRQARPDQLGVRGTPTLILVGGAGEVLDSWAGRLPADGEAEVLARLRGQRAGSE